jgi:hypothetical protein
MSTPMSLLVAFLGAALLRITHNGILAGQLPGGRNLGPVLSTDPSFWFSAAWEYSFALVMIAIGLAYLFDHGTLPPIDKRDTKRYIMFSLRTVAASLVLALPLRFLLPIFYA